MESGCYPPASTMVAKTRAYIAELDGLRAVAIGLVMLYHFWSYRGEAAVGRFVSQIASIGWMGVDVFFVISGFLITGILLAAKGRPHAWRTFYVRRALRIFPLYYAVLVLLVVLAATVVAFELPGRDSPDVRNVGRAWWNALYLSNVAIALHGSNWIPFDISWSLAVEEQFYLLYPFLVLGVSERRLGHVLVGIVASAIAFRVGWFVATGDAYGASALLPARMDQLAIGGLGTLLVRRADAGELRAVRFAAGPLAAVALALLLTRGRDDLAFTTAAYTLTALATGALVVGLASGGFGPVRRALSLAPVVWVGKVSYGLYLLHVFAREVVRRIPDGGLISDGSLLGAVTSVVIMTALACGLAAISWTLYERPILSLKDRWAPAAPPAEPPAPAPGVPRALARGGTQ